MGDCLYNFYSFLTESSFRESFTRANRTSFQPFSLLHAVLGSFIGRSCFALFVNLSSGCFLNQKYWKSSDFFRLFVFCSQKKEHANEVRICRFVTLHVIC